MQILLGLILGVTLTIFGAYEYDYATGRAPNGLTTAAASGQAPMVNWDVVGSDWEIFKSNVRATTDNLERKLNNRAG